MSQIFIHIGFHKTGTSAIQRWLVGHPDILQNKGLFYPQPLEDNPAHHELAFSLMSENPLSEATGPTPQGDRSPEEIIQHYIKAVSEDFEAGKILLSAEAMCRFLPDDIKRMQNIFSPYGDIKIVAYVRHPLDYELSRYHHRIRMGVETRPFEEYLDLDVVVSNADFHTRLGPWRDVFGPENVLIGEYRGDQEPDFDIVSDFMRLIGEPDIDVTRATDLLGVVRPNVGVHPWTLDLYTQVKHSDMDVKEKNKHINKILKLGYELPKIDAASFYLGDQKAAEIRRQLSALYNKLFEIKA